MNHALNAMEARLSAEDKFFLKKIYAPQEVTVPPNDACRGMCVTTDGEIRLYGAIDKVGPDDVGTPVYMASTDCGLSWKTHLMPEGALGAATRNPKTGRYITSYSEEFRPDLTDRFQEKGTYAMLSDVGYDDTDFRVVKLSEDFVHILKLPYYYAEIDRWFIVGEHRNADMTKVLYVFYSDDDGESWTTHIIEDVAPMHEAKPPHKGVRWQEYSCEPTIARLHDGTFIMLVRTSQDFHYIYRSTDNGETWSKPEPSVFHGTITMPVLEQLSDGKLVFFWCNNQPMPERDHEAVFPALSDGEKKGFWEDVFTNRDVNHLAVSEDDGNTWIGMRELALNGVRNNADFRSVGGVDSRDKSVHQGQMLELPFGKLLVWFGQNIASRKAVILDIDWLYERKRFEDFRLGLQSVTTHMFVESNLGGYRGFSGHCAYNRTNGALLVRDPDGNFEEALQIARTDDPRLVYQKQGVVWNFPAAKKGCVTVKLRVEGEGAAISLTDHWYNAFDETAKEEAPFTFDFTARTAEWCELAITFDIEKRFAAVTLDGRPLAALPMRSGAPCGLSYLHIQTLAEKADFDGTLVKALGMEVL